VLEAFARAVRTVDRYMYLNSRFQLAAAEATAAAAAAADATAVAAATAAATAATRTTTTTEEAALTTGEAVLTPRRGTNCLDWVFPIPFSIYSSLAL